MSTMQQLQFFGSSPSAASSIRKIFAGSRLRVLREQHGKPRLRSPRP
jgi:hypothetical protein